ncbi:MAG: DUF3877 family protein [Oscillospiraceae bacterium]|nr:DUF3877 family protein [Oscillospiraceae bacterium]
MINYDSLKKNLIDVIKESQIKIGYTPNPVGLSYPVASLNSFLGTECTVSEMKDVLQDFCESVRKELGDIQISLSETNYFLTVPPEGVKYIHEHVEGSPFLKDFIHLLTTEHNIGIEKILEIFRKYSDNVICREIHDEEFSYLIYFADGIPDDYRYCIDIDFGHATYHRFTPADYDALGFAE